MSDGRLVYIKRVPTGSDEEKIACMFSENDLHNDPRNHCVPILDLFKDDEDERISYMVMPFLRLANDPRLYHVNDVVEFIDQFLEVCSWRMILTGLRISSSARIPLGATLYA